MTVNPSLSSSFTYGPIYTSHRFLFDDKPNVPRDHRPSDDINFSVKRPESRFNDEL